MELKQSGLTKPLLVALALFAAAEAVWLLSMRPLYRRWFAAFSGPLALRSVAAAAATYAVLLAGALVFVALPAARDQGPAWRSVARGMLFGATVYGVYNLTNKSTIPKYPWAMAAVDTAWGATLFGGVALACRLVR